MNMPTAIDMQTTKYGELHSNVYFSSISFLARALNRRSYDLAVFSRAVRVLADKGKVEGVEVMTPDKKSYVLKAKKVVLCTSTIETPRLLLYSGIPGHSIGHYLTDHSLVGGPLKINRVLYPYVLGTIGILLPQIAGIPFQVQIEGPTRTQFYHNKEIPFRSEEEIYFNGVGVVQTRYENRITLNPYERDYFGIPKVEFHVSYTAEDINNLDMAEHAVNRAAAALGLGAAHFGRREILAGDHESCTCRMGEDPATSATNRFGQIHGVSGLFVADNSVLPFMEAANPTLTTVALAIRTADYIVRTTV
jgi:choline dehydrogenase-like flavoprotein